MNTAKERMTIMMATTGRGAKEVTITQRTLTAQISKRPTSITQGA